MHTAYQEILSTNDTPRITTLTWHPYRIPMRTGFSTAHGLLTHREGAIIEIHTNAGFRGIGEIAPLPEFRGNTLQTALQALPALTKQLEGSTLTQALTQLITSTLPMPTQSGVELALLDALGKSRDYPIYTLLGEARRSQIAVNVVIGATKLEDAISAARRAIADGSSCIKLKMVGEEPEQIERVAAIRAAIGPTPHLRLDANEGWTAEQAYSILSGCAPYDIQYVEQPLPAANLKGMRDLRKEVPIPLAADEAIIDLKSARRVLEAEAADILIIKPQLAGGLYNSLQIIGMTQKYGAPCVITSTLESGIGIAGALQLAATIQELPLECGLATLDLLVDDLLEEGLPIRRGQMAVPDAPGLGVFLDKTALAYYTAQKHI